MNAQTAKTQASADQQSQRESRVLSLRSVPALPDRTGFVHSVNVGRHAKIAVRYLQCCAMPEVLHPRSSPHSKPSTSDRPPAEPQCNSFPQTLLTTGLIQDAADHRF